MRLHEIVQITLLILATVILPVLLLREVSDNFKFQKNFWLVLIFIVGIYFYATGNGIHEVSSFNFNHFCDIKSFTGDLCGGFFFNDYYTGNIYYFIGGILMLTPLLLLEKLNPRQDYHKKDLWLGIVNAIIYSLAIFAYAAFDPVLVGLIYSVIMTIIAVSIFWSLRKKYLAYPVISYTALTYVLGTLLALFVRFH